MAMSLGLAGVFSASDSEGISSDDGQAIVDNSPCYALLEFPDCFYRVQSLKLVLGREPDDFNTYNQRLIVSDQKPPGSRKRKRSDISDDDDNLSTHSALDALAIKQELDYDNCVTAIGGIGGPQASLSDDPNEVFIAIHPNVDDDGDVKDKAISKKHLRFIFSEELGWHLEIIGRNGVYLNEVWHGKGEQVLLEDKDVLTVVGLRFRWHTTSPEGEESDLESLSDFDEEEGAFGMPILKHESSRESDLALNGIDVDMIGESEEDDGYQEDEEDVDRPLANVIRKRKKKAKDKDGEKRQEQETTTKGLKLTLKLPKAKLHKGTSSKAPKLKTTEKDEKAEDVDNDKNKQTDDLPKPASKKPKLHNDKAKKSVENLIAPTNSSNGNSNVVQSVEKTETAGQDQTAATKGPTPTRAGAVGDSETPGATAQPGPVRDPVLHGEAPPPKRRGPGRPPADGVMSKRERRERQKAEQMGIPYGEPLPFKSESKKEGEGGEKKKKPKKDHADADQEDDDDAADGETAEAETPAVPRAPSPKESDYPPEKLVKPEETYQVLLYQVLSETTTPLALPQVYEAIKNKWPYFRFKVGGTGWESSVRHNLQSSKYFKKAGKAGKGHLWAIDPDEPFEHKVKRADPPQASSYQAPRPYQYQQGYQAPNRAPGAQPYAGYYGGPGAAVNGQRPGVGPHGQPYPAFYPQGGAGAAGARPGGAMPAYPPARPGQPNAFGTPGAPGAAQPRAPSAFDQVCNGIIPEVFLKFQEQLEKLSQPSADGTNIAVEQAALAIKWIMAHPRSDDGIEKEGSQLQHMVKVLRSLLHTIIPPPQARTVPPGPMVNRPQAGVPGAQNTFSTIPPRPQGTAMVPPAGSPPARVVGSQGTPSSFARPGQQPSNTAFSSPQPGQFIRPVMNDVPPNGQSQFMVRPPGAVGQTPTPGPVLNVQGTGTPSQPTMTNSFQVQKPQAVNGTATAPSANQPPPTTINAQPGGPVQQGAASLAQTNGLKSVQPVTSQQSASSDVPATTKTPSNSDTPANPSTIGGSVPAEISTTSSPKATTPLSITTSQAAAPSPATKPPPNS